ncbi:MAG: hypothetical protein KatS3mg102_0560 [Planctomycetota bacterium]|nr:MAG: hypothetical protein KatS3mg102_0560 [Planctomycetota bacterium]
MTRISRRFVLYAPLFVVPLAALVLSTATFAYIRLVHPGTGGGLYWANQPVTYTLHASGSDDMPEDDRELLALRMAFETWSSIPGSKLRFVESSAASTRPKVHDDDGINLVFFDETNATGLFTGQSQIVAITPVWFDGAGRIYDADIIFNGKDHRFSTDLAPGTFDFDAQAIATHEIGHFIGLDHTGIYGSTLLPFAFVQDWRPRSLAFDEVAAARVVYPEAGAPAPGAIEGWVLWEADGNPVVGAHVVATNATTGETAASARTATNGYFKIGGLEPGSYHVYAEPLDGPTTGAKLQLPEVQTGFGTLFYGGNLTPLAVAVAGGQTRQLEALRVQASSGFNLSGASPLTVPRGTLTTVTLQGSGLSRGQVVQVSGPGITVVGGSGNTGTLGFGASFTVEVDLDAAPGLRDIYVFSDTGGTRRAVALPGGLEIRAEPPSIAALSPGSGPASGGTVVRLSGDGFAPGLAVLFGDRRAASVVLLDPGTVDATTPPGTLGAVDVVVLNPDGQQAVRRNGFSYTGQPRIDSVSPAHGPSAGGVAVTIAGAQFASGARVLIGGRAASGVSVSSDGRTISCIAPPGSLGAADVRVDNPDGSADVLAGGYSYRPPSLSSLSPSAGSTTGGTWVRLFGDDLPPNSTVTFGNLPASAVSFVSQTEVRASTPAGAPGAVTVTLRTPDGLTTSLAAAFSYVEGTEPRLQAVSPGSGPTTGGTALELSGSGFEPGAAVLVRGVPARDVVVESANRLRCVSPPGQAGPADVTVRNPNLLEGTLPGGFTYTQVVAAGTSGGSGGGCALAGAGADSSGAAGWLVGLAGLLLWRACRRSRRHAAGWWAGVGS